MRGQVHTAENHNHTGQFPERRNEMVISTKKIINHSADIILVSHDFENGMWQFLDGFELKEEDAVIVSLQEIVEFDSTVTGLHDLPLGWIASRNGKKDNWKLEKK
jgi:hypothetical protein